MRLLKADDMHDESGGGAWAKDEMESGDESGVDDVVRLAGVHDIKAEVKEDTVKEEAGEEASHAPYDEIVFANGLKQEQCDNGNAAPVKHETHDVVVLDCSDDEMSMPVKVEKREHDNMKPLKREKQEYDNAKPVKHQATTSCAAGHRGAPM